MGTPDMYCDLLAELSRRKRLCLGDEQSGTLLVAGFDQLDVIAEQMHKYSYLSAPMGHIALTLFGFQEDSTTTGKFEDACVYYHGTNALAKLQFLKSMTLYGLLRSQNSKHSDWSLTDFLFKTPRQIWPWLFEIGNGSSILLSKESYGTLVKCTFDQTAWDSFVKANSVHIADFVSRQGTDEDTKSWKTLVEAHSASPRDQLLLAAFLKTINGELASIRRSIRPEFENNYGQANDYLIPLLIALSKTLLMGVCNVSGVWEHCKYFAFSALPVFKHEQIEKSCAGLFFTSNGIESPSETIEKLISTTHFLSTYWTYNSYRTAAVSMALRHATRAASSAILSRNKSHHIGSHVMPRATVKDIERRLAELYLIEDDPPHVQEEVFPSIERLKTALDDFIQKKDDFLAEVTTDPCSSSDTKLLGRDIIAPLMRHALLMDTIARNEGYGYELHPSEELSEDKRNLLKRESNMECRRKMAVEMRMHSTLSVSLCISADGECRRILGPDLPPYDPFFWPLDSRGRESSLFGVVSGCADRDPLIAVPGMVGQYALYGILENIIRNAAKHDKDKNKDKSKGLHIHLHVEDDPDAPNDYYCLSIWDDRATPANAHITSTIPGDPNGEKRERRLDEHLQCWADADLIDPSGAVRREAWGVAEIVICANLLAGRAQYDNEIAVGGKPRKVVRVFCGPRPHIEGKALSCDGRDVSHDGCQGQRLIHQLRLLKAKRAAFVGKVFHEAWSGATDDGLRKDGIYMFADTEALKDFLRASEARQAFQFVVFDGDDVPQTILDDGEKGANAAFLSMLPFRLLWVTAGEDRISRRAGQAEVVSMPVRNLGELMKSPTADALMERLWQNWIKLNAKLNPEGKVVSSLVYLDIKATEDRYKKWAQSARVLNETKGPVRVCPHSSDQKTVESGIPDAKAIRSAFVRHKDTLGELRPDDMFESFGKRSPDCDILLGAILPGEQDAYWELPYTLAEAGLLRILVIDERMAERAMMPYNNDPRIRERLQKESKTLPCFWHLSQRAKVYIATHIQVGDAPDSVQPLHKSYADAKSRRRDEKGSENNISCPSLHISITAQEGLKTKTYDPVGSGDQHEAPTFDIVVIHQGVIDAFRPKNENGENQISEEEMRAWIEKFHPWLVVESGRGIPPGLQKKPIRFLSFSVLDQALTPDGIGKLLLTRRLMALPRFVENGEKL